MYFNIKTESKSALNEFLYAVPGESKLVDWQNQPQNEKLNR